MSKNRISRIIAFLAVVIGTILFSQLFWPDILGPLIYDQSGEYRKYHNLFLLLRELQNWSCLCSIPILMGGIAGLILTLPPSQSGSRFASTHRLGLAALTVAALAHLFIFVSSLDFFFVPAGSSIRPMMWAVVMSAIAAGTFLIAFPLSIFAMFRERPRILGAVTLILSLTPFFFARGILYLAAAIKGFKVAD